MLFISLLTITFEIQALKASEEIICEMISSAPPFSTAFSVFSIKSDVFLNGATEQHSPAAFIRLMNMRRWAVLMRLKYLVRP